MIFTEYFNDCSIQQSDLQLTFSNDVTGLK